MCVCVGKLHYTNLGTQAPIFGVFDTSLTGHVPARQGSGQFGGRCSRIPAVTDRACRGRRYLIERFSAFQVI